MAYCCKSLEESIENGGMVYDQVMASIQFYIKSAWNEPGIFYRRHADYCPYCGTKLHRDLDGPEDTYRNCLEEAVGKEYCDIAEDEIPGEFKSDEWWKKRGL